MSVLNIAEDVIKAIKSRGVEGEVVLSKSESTTVSQRLLKLEETLQNKGCNIGIRVVVDGKKYSCISSNDLDRVNELIDAAIAMAQASPEDPYLCQSGESGTYINAGSELEICDDTVCEIDEIKHNLHVMEDAALSLDPKIVNSEGASFSKSISDVALLTSQGFVGSYKRSSFSTSVSVIASDNGKMEVDYSFSVKNKLADLEDAVTLGKEAARRALRKLNAKSIKTSKMPVLFENRIASSLLGNFAHLINGMAIADKSSFLLEDMNAKIFGNDVCIIDDPTMVGGLSSFPFDGEGILGRKRDVVEDGVLQSWTLDMRTAKQLGLQTTGNARRHGNASVSPGVSNFYIKPTDVTVEDLMSDIKNGVYITDLFGFGINYTTGDYSQGAFGFMVENGRITYPINGITIAGNLRDMFLGMRVANDLSFLKSINSPTLLIDNMVISGSD